MAEEMTNPVETEAAAPAAAPEAVLTAEPEAPAPKRKGSPLLVVLTVLLTLVGITDLILWGVAGYYFLRSF